MQGRTSCDPHVMSTRTLPPPPESELQPFQADTGSKLGGLVRGLPKLRVPGTPSEGRRLKPPRLALRTLESHSASTSVGSIYRQRVRLDIRHFWGHLHNPWSPNLEDSLPHQSTKVQASEEAIRAAQGAVWGAAQGAGRGQALCSGSVPGREAEKLVWVQHWEGAAGGEWLAVPLPPPHMPLLSPHLEGNRQVRTLKTTPRHPQ